ASPEKYLRPEVIRQVARLDLRAKFIVEGFLAGLHASPFQGFSVEFSEHRKYVPGDDLKDLDWNVFAKTDKYYLKKFQAETNVTGYLVMDLSASMGYTYRQELTKFEYAICLAAALGDLLTEPEPFVKSLYHLRHRGHEVILFHVLDEAEVRFPFEGVIEFEDPEAGEKLTLDAKGMRADYTKSVEEFRQYYRDECAKAN